MRDSQRALVYQAQFDWLDGYPKATRVLTAEQAQQMVTRIAARHRIRRPTLTLSGRLRTSAGLYDADDLSLPHQPTVWAVCHEMAHHGADLRGRDGEPDHGPRFVAWFVRIVEREMGEMAAKRLRRCFDKVGL